MHWRATMTQCPEGATTLPDVAPEGAPGGEEGALAAEQCLAEPKEAFGLDFLRFDAANRVELIVSMTMRPYANVRVNAPRGDNVD